MGNSVCFWFCDWVGEGPCLIYYLGCLELCPKRNLSLEIVITVKGTVCHGGCYLLVRRVSRYSEGFEYSRPNIFMFREEKDVQICKTSICRQLSTISFFSHRSGLSTLPILLKHLN